jgi:hypothetical protein
MPAWAVINDPVLWLKMDEGTGGAGATITDSAASPTTVTLGGGTANPGWVVGHIGPYALEWDGVDAVVTVTQAAKINNLAAMTVAFWARFDTRGEAAVSTLMTKSPSSNGWVLSLDDAAVNQGIRFRAYWASTPMTTRSVADVIFLDTTWRHYMLTWDGSGTSANVHIYINNSEVGYTLPQDGSPSRVDDSANNLLIGNDAGGATTIDGALDDLRIYNRVLSSQDRADLYAYTGATTTPVRHRIIQSQVRPRPGHTGTRPRSLLAARRHQP